MRVFVSMVVLVLTSCVVNDVCASLITVPGGNILTQAWDNVNYVENPLPGETDIDTFGSMSIPFDDVLMADDGVSESMAHVTYTDAGQETKLQFDLTQVRAGQIFSYAEFYYDMSFTATADANYSLTGIYKKTSGEDRITYRVTLTDLSDSSLLFSSLEISDEDEASLSLSGPGTTGALVLGRHYRLYIDAFIQNFIGFDPGNPENPTMNDDGASAVGEFAFTVTGSVAAVPEPTSMALLSIAAAGGICGLRWRRTRRSNVTFNID